MKLKPKAYSMGSCGHEIVYRCGKDGCDFKFTMANGDWHFCPKCGTGISWGVVTRANEEWKQEFLSVLDDTIRKASLLEELDKLNATIIDEDRREMQITPATQKANRKSNIQYFLGIGWTKEDLIAKRGFTEKDFEGV